MNTSIFFFNSPLGPTSNTMDVPFWTNVTETYDTKNHRKTLGSMLRYLDKSINENIFSETDTLQLAHGSIVLELSITDNQFQVNSPFVALPEGPKIPILRKVAQLNFNPLNKSQIVLDSENQLTFRYSIPLETVEPYSLYDAFREICMNADVYDDIFVDKFSATRLREPLVDHYSESEIDVCWEIFQTSISETMEYVTHFESKRWDDNLFEILYVFLTKMDFFISIQGSLRSKFEESLHKLRGREPFTDRVEQSKAFLMQLKNMDKAEFAKDIYHIKMLVPYKYGCKTENLADKFSQGYGFAKEKFGHQNFVGATTSLLYDYYGILYYNMPDEEDGTILCEALQSAGGKPWNEAAKALLDGVQRIIEKSKEN